MNKYLTQWQTHRVSSVALTHYSNSKYILEVVNEFFCDSQKNKSCSGTHRHDRVKQETMNCKFYRNTHCAYLRIIYGLENTFDEFERIWKLFLKQM